EVDLADLALGDALDEPRPDALGVVAPQYPLAQLLVVLAHPISLSAWSRAALSSAIASFEPPASGWHSFARARKAASTVSRSIQTPSSMSSTSRHDRERFCAGGDGDGGVTAVNPAKAFD